jgi:ubiquinone/menaquinone biosynthesis C-methylase UbiE
MDQWSARAQAYVESDAHREGEDLDRLVVWAAGARTALDVATGGGHVATRLREAGLEVVTCDPAPGMRPDVICRAESLPFAARAFDVVACRTAAHHFSDIRASVREMARVSGDRVRRRDEHASEFLSLGVRPTHQRGAPDGPSRREIALMLMDAACEHLPMPVLACVDETNVAASRMYDDLGWEVTDRQTAGWPVTQLVYRWDGGKPADPA